MEALFNFALFFVVGLFLRKAWDYMDSETKKNRGEAADVTPPKPHKETMEEVDRKMGLVH